jgi:hypothetical protein
MWPHHDRVGPGSHPVVFFKETQDRKEFLGAGGFRDALGSGPISEAPACSAYAEPMRPRN